MDMKFSGSAEPTTASLEEGLAAVLSLLKAIRNYDHWRRVAKTVQDESGVEETLDKLVSESTRDSKLDPSPLDARNARPRQHRRL